MKFALYSVFHPKMMVSLTHRVAMTTSMQLRWLNISPSKAVKLKHRLMGEVKEIIRKKVVLRQSQLDWRA